MNSCSPINIIFHHCRSNLSTNIHNAFSRRNNFSHAINKSRRFHVSEATSQSHKDNVLLTPQEVTFILRQSEFQKDFTKGVIKSYDSNQLASNDPIEDTRLEAECRVTSGTLLGVFDGHGGPACAQVISTRLFRYIAATLLPAQQLEDLISNGDNLQLLETINDKIKIVDDLKAVHEHSFRRYLDELSSEGVQRDVRASLERAILALDRDISREVVEPFQATGEVDTRALSVALSGAVAVVCHVDGPHLHVANVGDCNAVLGRVTDESHWTAKKITREHNAENYDEVKRIWGEHPAGERRTAIRRDRLLGELAPLRSLGDYRYKWTAEQLTRLAAPVVGPKAVPANYHTPPYLTAQPDMFYHRLTPRDRFMIIASDGLWDMMTPLQAVKLVGEHMQGKVFFNPLKLPRKDIALGDINELLRHRRDSLKSKPKDRNAATHLIRHAIGGTEYGVDHARLAHLLSLAPDVSRMFRDDITVTVVYFDDEFLRQCPS